MWHVYKPYYTNNVRSRWQKSRINRKKYAQCAISYFALKLGCVCLYIYSFNHVNIPGRPSYFYNGGYLSILVYLVRLSGTQAEVCPCRVQFWLYPPTSGDVTKPSCPRCKRYRQLISYMNEQSLKYGKERKKEQCQTNDLHSRTFWNYRK